MSTLQKTASTFAENSYDDNEIVNPSANPHMNELVAAMVSRRQALRGGVSVTAATLLGGLSLTACGGGDDPAPVPAPVPPTAKPLALDRKSVV